MDDAVALMNQRLTDLEQNFIPMTHRIADLERRVRELEAERPTVLDNVTETVKEARKGLGSILSKASKAISGEDKGA